MKALSELTEQNAKEILKHTFPNDYTFFKGIDFKPKTLRDSEGKERTQITFGGRLCVGINYTNDSGDGCILHFDDPRVVYWLYKNEFDVLDLLERNQDLAVEMQRLDDIIYMVHELNRVIEKKIPTKIPLIDYLTKKLKEIEEHAYKDL